MDFGHDGPFNNWLEQMIEQGMVRTDQGLDEIMGVFPNVLLCGLRDALERIFGCEEARPTRDESAQTDAVVFCLRLAYRGKDASKLVVQEEIHGWIENLWRITNLELMRRSGLIREWSAKTLDRKEDIIVDGDNEPERWMKWMVSEREKRSGSPEWSERNEQAFWAAMSGAQRQLMEDMGLDMVRVIKTSGWH